MVKVAAFLISLLLALSCIAVASASDAYAYDAPHFFAKLVDRSYDVPANTYVDSYTGKTVIAPGYHVEKRTIELTITNPIIEEDKDYLFYNVRVSGHFLENWTTLYNTQSGVPISDGDITQIVFVSAIKGKNFYGPSGASIYAPTGGQIDIQVAIIKHSVETYDNHQGQWGWGYRDIYTQISPWSESQTITVDEENNQTPFPTATESPTATANSPSVTPNFTANPDTNAEPFFGSDSMQVAVAALVAMVVGLVIVVAFQQRRLNKISLHTAKNTKQQSTSTKTGNAFYLMSCGDIVPPITTN